MLCTDTQSTWDNGNVTFSTEQSIALYHHLKQLICCWCGGWLLWPLILPNTCAPAYSFYLSYSTYLTQTVACIWRLKKPFKVLETGFIQNFLKSMIYIALDLSLTIELSCSISLLLSCFSPAQNLQQGAFHNSACPWRRVIPGTGPQWVLWT